MLNTLLEFLKEMLVGLVEMLGQFVLALRDVLVWAGQEVLIFVNTTLASQLPSVDFTSLETALAIGNYWTPLDTIVAGLLLYLAYWAFLVPVRMVLSVIQTV